MTDRLFWFLIVTVALAGSVALVVSAERRGDERYEVSPDSPAPKDVYNPVEAGERTPSGFRQLLSRDQILPVYEPTFRLAAENDWDPETVVIGVELNGESKVYPVNFLNRREMVNDRIGGTPVLVSW